MNTLQSGLLIVLRDKMGKRMEWDDCHCEFLRKIELTDGHLVYIRLQSCQFQLFAENRIKLQTFALQKCVRPIR